MSFVKEFVNCMAFNRNAVIDIVCNDLNSQNTKELIDKCNDGTIIDGFNDNFTISPDNKYLLRLISSKYLNTKYPNTPIYYIPTKEFIEELNMFIYSNKITTVDFFGSEYPIIPAALTKINQNLKIDAMSVILGDKIFDNLKLYPITNRGLRDYDYYDQLGLKFPEMIIIDEIYIEKVSEKKLYNMMKKSYFNHVVLITSAHTNNVLDLLFHLKRNTNYNCRYIPINLIKPDSELKIILDGYYDYNTVMFIFSKKDLNMNLNSKEFFNKISIDTDIDMFPTYMEIFSLIYVKYSKSLVSDIFKKIIEKDYNKNEQYSFICAYKTIILSANEVHYIEKWNEFVFFIGRLANGFFPHLTSRIDFLDLMCYFDDVHKNKPLLDRSGKMFPIWLTKAIDKFIYAYLTIVNYQDNGWRTSLKNMSNTWTIVNENNRKIMMSSYY